MDREAAVLRAEMSRTRAELDQKLSKLQAKVIDLSPRRLTKRYMPDYLADRAIGTILTLVGMKMVWAHFRNRRQPRHRTEPEAFGYATWEA